MIGKLFVVGAGFMGNGIAQTAISKGIAVTMYDITDEAVQSGRDVITKNMSKLVAKGRLSQEEMDAALGRLTCTSQLTSAKDAGFVIEAVKEDYSIKKEIFRQLDEICGPETILASNTSSLSVLELARATMRPDKVIGTHFFSPVPVMPLLELVVSLLTSEETYNRAFALGELLGKVNVRAQDRCGFIVNRLLIPFLNEACCLLEEGVGTVEDIDAAVKCGLNHPMGPLELLDLIGADVALAIMETLYEEYKDPKYRPCVTLKNRVRAGLLGRKTGKGFYDYKK